ncbi:MAG: O-antigen ligase family protein [Pseudomonas sp.]|nr:O-antigen ligase family protein [Pseudomonas sp.]
MGSNGGNWRHTYVAWMGSYLIPGGLVCLFCGLLWAPKTSVYHSLFYGLVALPALLSLVLRPHLTIAIGRIPIVALFLLFGLWALLSLAWGDPSAETSSLIKRPLYIALLFVACCLVVEEEPKRLQQCLWVAAMMMLPLTAYCLTKFTLLPNGTGRLIGTGLLDNPLLSSHVFGFFASFWIAVAIDPRSRHTALAVLAASLMWLAMLATGSRTPLVATSLAIIWLVMCNIGYRSLLIGILASLGLALLLCAPELITSRGTSYRLELWQAAFRLIAEKPFIGHGFSTEMSLVVNSPKNWTFREPHNFALNVWHNVGIVGLLLWLSMYAVALRACWRWRKEPAFLIAGAVMVYGIGAGLSEGGGILPRPKEHWFVIWIPLALVAALVYEKMRAACKRLSTGQFGKLIHDGQVIEADGLGPKVYLLRDASILKVFRRRPWLSGGSLWPYAKRFATNAETLRKRGFTTPEIISVYHFEDSVNATAVHYRALPGTTLRKALRDAPGHQRELWVEMLGKHLAELHQKGVYFRSAHLGNFLLMPGGSLGMIDLADLRLSCWSLGNAKRARNLRHICRYDSDRQWLFEDHLQAFLRGYANRAPEHVEALSKAIKALKT